MNNLPLAYAFGAGLLATLNPCCVAMLPSFLAFYIGANNEGYEHIPLHSRLKNAVMTGILVTLGFLTIYLGGGILVSLGLQMFINWVPQLTILIGSILMVMGGTMLLGHSLKVHLFHPQWSVKKTGLLPMFLYGVSYAIASLSCTLPMFLIIVGSTASAPGPLSTLLMFLSYGLGIAVVLIGITCATMLFQTAVNRWLHRILPYVQIVSGLLLIGVGAYLIYYQLHFAFRLF